MPLDFIVFGVPRSGTTAVTHALNLHPQIMCGNEYFPGFESACFAHVPNAFNDETFAHTPNCASTRSVYRAKDGTARIFGNKDPRYLYYLGHFNARSPTCRKVCVYRPRLNFWGSWDARARNYADAYWERGQTGFFGVLELVCLLGHITNVPSSGEVLIVNYDALFFDEPNTIQAVYDYLGAERNDDAQAAFHRDFFSPAGLAKFRPNEDATAVYEFLQLGNLESRILERPTVTNVEIVDALNDYLRSTLTRVSDLIDRQFSRMSPNELLYFVRSRLLCKELASLGINSCAQRAFDEIQSSMMPLESSLQELSASFDRLRIQSIS